MSFRSLNAFRPVFPITRIQAFSDDTLLRKVRGGRGWAGEGGGGRCIYQVDTGRLMGLQQTYLGMGRLISSGIGRGGGYGINLVTRQLLSIAGKFELPRRFPLDGSSPFILVCSMDILYRA